MEFKFIVIEQWPVLAWLAELQKGGDSITVFHGSDVEISNDWFCEAVWDGAFSQGDFDKTDIVAGSGARLRDHLAVFVSSGSSIDRLQSIRIGNTTRISNSLPCLLTAVDASVASGYAGYFDDFGTINDGLNVYKRELLTTAGTVELLYFNNLVWDGETLVELEKPCKDRDFRSFERYYRFLTQAFTDIAANMSDPARKIRYRFLGTLSSGYDSTTATTLAAQVGCKEAISFSHARGGEADDGAETARVLGIDLKVLDRESWKTKDFCETRFITADAKGEDRYFFAADELVKHRVLVTGFHGDKMWEKHNKKLSAQIIRGDRSGLSLTEYRLHRGFLNCPVAFWGSRQIRDVNAISNSDEMKPWDFGGSYNRPICRRISESAGIPRNAFGIKKRASSEQAFASSNFLTSTAMSDYMKWLRSNRWRLVKQGGLPIFISRSIDQLIYHSISLTQVIALKFRAFSAKSPGLWKLTNNKYLFRLATIKTAATPVYLRKYIFSWALEHAKKFYVTPNKKSADINKREDPGIDRAAA